ncbi:hypothetical protein [Methylobacterium haplocladii]|uniref:Uncharacterized protein n=1 Tax=Methylobacterium haplocladii TaxID=1176176 RepID=A0A512ITU3_9HYPH|nr:hypothetical protein [Methylobacterium haplocladii]GEP01124.1 hypothetical protein MHA02_35110 [Methylobacterium haplocladii]GJD82916.1 hypothetical protein HPGCJGGD_0778 [Methylobacterium haplocladii]GLS60451.1 hypothetical protein GCM10007887_31300 [Methylobacterium haplocladii]
MVDLSYLPRLRHRLAGLRLSVALFRLRLGIKAGFDPAQPRDEDGRWTDVGGGEARQSQRYKTGNPKIDATSDELADIVSHVANSLLHLKGAAFGTAVHLGSAEAVRALDLPGIGKHGVEQSFSLGGLVRYGLADSVRTDFVKRNGRGPTAPIMAVWDIKTGGARLTPTRVRQIRSELNIGDDSPVIELHVIKGIRVKAAGPTHEGQLSYLWLGGWHVA